MKKTTWLLLILLIAFSHLNAQRKKIDSLISVVNALPDTGKMNVYYSLGAKYINISIDSSTMYLFKAIDLAKKFNNKWVEASSYSLLGVAEKNKGNYDVAITYHLNSLKINEERGDEKAMAISYNDLGVLYKNMKRFDDALKYYMKSNELCRKIKLSKGVSMTYNNIGTIMKAKNMPDSALYYYSLALNTAQETGDTYSISTCLANIGETYNESKRYTDALNIFKECLVYDKKNEDKDGMASSYLEIAQTLTNLGSYSSAKKYADSAYRLCEQEKLMTVMLDVLQVQAELYKKMGNINEALAIKEKYIAIKDTIMNQETSKHIAEYQTKYETEKKEKEIITLKQQKEIAALQLSKQELRLQKTRYQMLAIIGIGLLLSIVTYLLYYRQQIKQKQAREKAVLTAEYNEWLRIAKDVHDDLGSGLSKISMMADIAQKKSTNNLKLGNDIQYISTISKELADNLNSMVLAGKPGETILDHSTTQLTDIGQGLSKISLTAQMAKQEAISNAAMDNDIRQIASVSKELIDNMRDLIWVLNPENTTLDNLVARLREYCADYLDGLEIEVVLDFPGHIPEMRISRESQRNIFSTVKEAINNCVKHAGANEIRITLKLDNDKFNIAVSDNGKGFEMNNLKGRGNGLRNMKQRIEAIGGVFSIISSATAGTAINISISFKKLNLELKNTTIV